MKSQTKTLLIAGGGLAVLGLGVYFMTKKAAAAPQIAATANPTAGGSTIVATDPVTGITTTRDQADQMACRLMHINTQATVTAAARWRGLVTSNGGTPTC